MCSSFVLCLVMVDCVRSLCVFCVCAWCEFVCVSYLYCDALMLCYMCVIRLFCRAVVLLLLFDSIGFLSFLFFCVLVFVCAF